MDEPNCGECGAKLEPLLTSANDAGWAGEPERMEMAPGDFEFLGCPGCGATWKRDADGILKKSR